MSAAEASNGVSTALDAGAKRTVFDFVLDDSRIFPGTTRAISVYVPACYRAERPACVYFSLDGLLFDLPDVFDELIEAGQMPVTIAVGVKPGIVDSIAAPANPRYHRSAEFDGLNETLARFLAENVVPAVERCKGPDGLPLLLSRDPNDCAVGGVSTGGVGAFTAAWERPDLFRRVFTGIGTFVGMRGADRYPVLVRKTEPKPLRVFMQDGSNDQWLGGPELGDWWMGNQTLQRALEFAGYQVQHTWDDSDHDPRHAAKVFPEAMRWLWRGWPEPIVIGNSQNTFLKSILLPAQEWQVVGGNYRSAGALALSPAGEVAFRDAASARTCKIGTDGATLMYESMVTRYSSMAYDADGRCYTADAETGRISIHNPHGAGRTIANGIRGLCLAARGNGALYVAGSDDDGVGKLWAVASSGEKSLLDSGLRHPSAIALSPDSSWLAIAERDSHWGYSYSVRPDGSLQDKQRFYWFHVPDDADDSGVGAWVTDQAGRLYAATRMGVQIFDRNGRVRAILPVPGGEATSLSFGGSDLSVLFVSAANGRIYRRKLNASGVRPGAAPIELPAWTAG